MITFFHSLREIWLRGNKNFPPKICPKMAAKSGPVECVDELTINTRVLYRMCVCVFLCVSVLCAVDSQLSCFV